MGILSEIEIVPAIRNALLKKAEGRKVVVVLSSGGLRTVCHLPLLRVLEETGLHVDALWGVSAGSIAGGLWASGRTAVEIEEAMLGFKKRQLFEFFPYTAIKAIIPSRDAERAGLLTGRKIEYQLSKLVGEKNNPLMDIRNFRILAYNRILNCKAFMRLGEEPGTIEVTQEKTGKTSIEKGTIIDMLRASFGTPVMFTPKRLNGQLYIDGGIAENYPVLTAFSQYKKEMECGDESRGLLLIGVNISYSGEFSRGKTNLIKSVAETYEIIGTEFTRLHLDLLTEMIKSSCFDCEIITIDPDVHELALTDLGRVPETLEKAAAKTIETLSDL